MNHTLLKCWWWWKWLWWVGVNKIPIKINKSKKPPTKLNSKNNKNNFRKKKSSFFFFVLLGMPCFRLLERGISWLTCKNDGNSRTGRKESVWYSCTRMRKQTQQFQSGVNKQECQSKIGEECLWILGNFSTEVFKRYEDDNRYSEYTSSTSTGRTYEYLDLLYCTVPLVEYLFLACIGFSHILYTLTKIRFDYR